MDITSILEKVDSEVFGIWFLIGAALVFFMQCGFAMVETGFTRAKNAGNIIMKFWVAFAVCQPWAFSQIIKILIGLILYLTLYFAQQRQLSFQVQWLSVQSFQAIVFIQL